MPLHNGAMIRNSEWTLELPIVTLLDDESANGVGSPEWGTHVLSHVPCNGLATRLPGARATFQKLWSHSRAKPGTTVQVHSRFRVVEPYPASFRISYHPPSRQSRQHRRRQRPDDQIGQTLRLHSASFVRFVSLFLSVRFLGRWPATPLLVLSSILCSLKHPRPAPPPLYPHRRINWQGGFILSPWFFPLAQPLVISFSSSRTSLFPQVASPHIADDLVNQNQWLPSARGPTGLPTKGIGHHLIVRAIQLSVNTTAMMVQTEVAAEGLAAPTDETRRAIIVALSPSRQLRDEAAHLPSPRRNLRRRLRPRPRSRNRPRPSQLHDLPPRSGRTTTMITSQTTRSATGLLGAAAK